MRIMKRTNIAFRVLLFCGVNSDRLVTKSEIAARCNISESHLAQVINQLAQMGYLHTQRGRSGGIVLGRVMEDIRIGEFFRRFEENGGTDACFGNVDGTCTLSAGCRLQPALAGAVEAFYAHLDKMTLADMIRGNDVLFDMLSPPVCAMRA